MTQDQDKQPDPPFFNRSNCQKWRDEGLGYEDIAVKTGFTAAHVKANLIRWGLFS